MSRGRRRASSNPVLGSHRPLLGGWWIATLLPLAWIAPTDVLAQEQPAYLDVVVNQVHQGTLLVYLEPGDVLVAMSDLEAAGLRGLAGERRDVSGRVFLSLASLAPDVAYEINEERLELALTVRPGLLPRTIVDLGSSRPKAITYGRERTAFLNYALRTGRADRVSGDGEAGLRLGGALLHGSLSRPADGPMLRGLTNVTVDDRPRMLRWVIGDHTTSAGTLSGSATLAGLSLSRDFGLDPYFDRYPSLGLSAVALSPSVLETYVNGRLVGTQTVPPGPIELRNPPVISGHGSVRVVVRDRFGAARELLSTYYFTPRLLACGLSEYDYSFGLRRERTESAQWDYRSLAFVGSHRIGITGAITAGGHLEADPRLVDVGPSLTARLPFGELDFAATASRREGVDGRSASLAYDYLGHPLAFGAMAQSLSAGWATLTSSPSADRGALQASASVGLQVTPRSSLGLRLSRAEFRSGVRNQEASFLGNVTLPGRLSLVVAGTRPLGGRARDLQLSIHLTRSIGTRTMVDLSPEVRDRTVTTGARIQQVLPTGSGYGYRIEGPVGPSGSTRTALQYQSPYGRYEATFDDGRSSAPRTVSVSGAVVAIDGRVHLTRPAHQGFALLRVPGLRGVRAYLGGQEVGRTNGRGELIVPNVLPNYGNRLTIEEKDVPVNYSIEANERIIAPSNGGAVLALFPVKRLQSITGRLLVDANGKSIVPAYGQLTLAVNGEALVSPLGKQGEFYLEDVPPGRYPAEVQFGDQVRKFEVRVPPSADPILDLGEVICVSP
jgi:outer membrane usher protein